MPGADWIQKCPAGDELENEGAPSQGVTQSLNDSFGDFSPGKILELLYANHCVLAITKINVFEMIPCIRVIIIAVQLGMGCIPSFLLDLPLVYVVIF